MVDSELKNQFQTFGIDVNQEVIDYCLVLCKNHGVDEQDIVNTWLAFSLSDLDGAMPTLELVQQMERKHFSDFNVSTPKNAKANTPIAIYSSSKRSVDNYGFSDLDTTPKGKSKFLKNDNDDSTKGCFSPASFSPNVTIPSPKYSVRTNAGQVVMSYSESSCNWKLDKSVLVEPIICQLNSKADNWKFMYETLHSMALILENSLENIAESIISKNNLMVENNSADISVYYGRVLCYDGKLNPNSILVQGPNGKLDVNMSDLIEFSLFPGQVIVFEGKITGNKITATKLYSSALPPQPDIIPDIKGPVQILVAAGPFTQLDTMSYEPLNDLLDYVSANGPNLLFLIGPLIDGGHLNVNKGDLAESFDLFYSRLLHNISTKVPNTKVFYITSSKDVFSIPVYPTPASTYCTSDDHSIILLPDPTLLSINGLVLGVTATDTLLHLGKKEISNGSNRLGRLAGHLLKQQSFYPLYPPDPEVSLDLHLWNQHAHLTVTPHLLVVPSGLHNFIKVVDDCVVINPERLVKGLVGGTFVRIEVKPQIEDEKWKAATHISAQIIKI